MGADPNYPWRAFGGWPGAAAASGAAGAGADSMAQDFLARFNQAARAYLDAAAAPNAEAAQIFSDTLRDLFAPLQPAPPAGGAAANGLDRRDPLSAAPALGLLREHQLRWQRLLTAAAQLEEAQRRLQRLWADVLRDAGAEFMTVLGRMAPPAATTAPGGAATLRRLYDAWIDCAESAYAKAAHGPAFCGALADAVNAGSRWRQEVKALVEESSKLLDLPTRSELNSLHARLRTVEAELRDARQAVRPARRRPPQTPPPVPPPRKPRPRRSGKK